MMNLHVEVLVAIFCEPMIITNGSFRADLYICVSLVIFSAGVVLLSNLTHISPFLNTQVRGRTKRRNDRIHMKKERFLKFREFSY